MGLQLLSTSSPTLFCSFRFFLSLSPRLTAILRPADPGGSTVVCVCVLARHSPTHNLHCSTRGTASLRALLPHAPPSRKGHESPAPRGPQRSAVYEFRLVSSGGGSAVVWPSWSPKWRSEVLYKREAHLPPVTWRCII